jgi:hypothetical protein
MFIRVTTRHGQDFDIHAAVIDPAKSPYARSFHEDVYQWKVRAFYAELGVSSAMWTTPDSQAFPKAFEPHKPIEYLLEVEEERVIAYVDEMTWSPYLHGMRPRFEYSRTPKWYENTSVLVATPIRTAEVKEIRRYRPTRTGHCQLVETVRLEIKS